MIKLTLEYHLKISLDFQPRPIVADHSRNGSCTEGVLDLDFNGQADLVTLDGRERLTEPIVDMVGLQELAMKSGQKLFTESQLKEAGLAPKMVERTETDTGVQTSYSEVSLAETDGGQSMLLAAESEQAGLRLDEQGYRPAGPMEFVIDPFNGNVFLSRKVTDQV
jgi:hypothetical protein